MIQVQRTSTCKTIIADMLRGNWTDRLSVSWPTMPETDGPETMGRVSSENTIVSAEGQPASETTIVDDIITAFNNLQYGPVPGSEDPDELFPSHIPQTREARQRAAALDATLASVSSVQGFFRQCSLPMMDLLPCQMRFDANYKNAFATHLLCNHIQADMRTLRDPFPPLGVRLLLSHSKIRRAENYAWRCPALRCQYWSMSKDAVVGHIPAHGRHNGFEPYRHGWQLKTNPVEIVHDILHA